MKLEHFGMPEPGDCRVVFSASAEELEAAVQAARDRAQPGDVVTLSPACAAFDCYANFMERGRVYKEMVKKLGE